MLHCSETSIVKAWAIHDWAAQALGVMSGQELKGTQLSLEYMLTCWQGWHGKKQLNWNFTNTSSSESLPTTNSHMQDLSARLEQFDSWNNLNNLTVCKILENKLAICKTTQDLFVRALPHQCNPVQLGIAYVMMCFRKPTHWHKNNRINRSIACYPSRKAELELRHKMESAVKSLRSKTVYSFYNFGAVSEVTV